MVSNAWPKEVRLRRPIDYRRVWSEGRSWAHSLFVVWALPNSMGTTRVGFTASKKIGNAVTRNRARRLLKEAMRCLYSELAPGWDIVLVARSRLPKARFQRVERDLRRAMRLADLIANQDNG